MMLSTQLFLAGLMACALHLTAATSCTSATSLTCAKTTYVTGTCSSNVCQCETDFTAVDTGCARSTSLPVEKPTVVSEDGKYSGEVLVGQTIVLTCKTAYTSGVSYKWYLDDAAISDTTATVSVSGTSNLNKNYKCTITVGGDESAKSDAFNVVAYETSGTVSKKPIITGKRTAVTAASKEVTLLCGNLPKDTSETIAFLAGTAAAGATNPAVFDVVSGGLSQAISCTLTSVNSGATVADGVSDTVTTPSAISSNLPVEEVVTSVYPTAPVVGGYMAVKCMVRADTLTGLTYTWARSGNPIAGQEDHALQVNNLVDATHGNNVPYSCAAMIGTESVSDDSSAVNIVALSTTTPTVSSPVSAPARYGVGTSYTLTCTSTSETPGMTYEWTKAGTVQSTTSKTLTITATSTATTYTCKAKLGSATSAASAGVSVEGKNVVSVSVVGPMKPVAGQSVTFTCQVEKGGSAANPTYVWKDDGAAINGQTSSTYTIATPSASTAGHNGVLTCEATIGSEAATASAGLTVAVTATPDAPSLSSSAASDIIRSGGSYTLTCASTSHVTAAVYEWKFTVTGGSEVTLAGSSMTYTISNAMTSNAGAYKCKVTVGSQASSHSPALTITYSATKGLPCTAIATCSSQDMTAYTGNCIAGYCECASTGTLNADGCTSSSTKMAVSFLLLLLGLLGIRLM
ncbi:pneumococcal serine-rich repeat protein [Aplysia californica]|uniref:Pneumococcal serine-rich repeat protein n=1 Tax=Aplysia californica TaxID=6500 RepID=A0ABM0JKD2_APLCA|nr:pneumococcal serine-rich repeat protein [Aplysia californica]